MKDCAICETGLKVENGDLMDDGKCLSCWMEEQPPAFPRDQWDVWIGTPDGWKQI